MSNDDKKNDRSELWSQLSAAGESVLMCAVLIGGGIWLGNLIDAKIHTTPWIALVLALGGLIGGMSYMVMKAMKTEKK